MVLAAARPGALRHRGYFDTLVGSGAQASPPYYAGGPGSVVLTGTGASSPSGYKVVSRDIYTLDQDVWADIQTGTTTEDKVIYLRCTAAVAAVDLTIIGRSSSSGLEVRDVSNNLLTTVPLTVTTGNFQTFRAVVVGTKLDVYVNGSRLVSQLTVPAATAGRTHGGFLVNTTQRVANFNALAA